MSGRPFTILGVIIAVVALVAFIFLGTRMSGGTRTGTGGPTAAVVVAAHDLALRVAITPSDVKVVQLSADSLPPQHFDNVDQVKNLIPIAAILKDQPLTANLLVSSPDEVAGAQAAFLPIPKGFVATTLPTSDMQGVAGSIQAGDYISVIVVMLSPSGKFQNVRTVYTNIHVLRTGSANLSTQAAKDRGSAPAATTSGATTLTVVVTQCQAEFLNWFIANGTIKYTLESYKDYSPKDAAIDQNCPNADAAKGVGLADVIRAWPGLAG
jgi:Flp pilus assembly protein CpaB